MSAIIVRQEFDYVSSLAKKFSCKEQESDVTLTTTSAIRDNYFSSSTFNTLNDCIQFILINFENNDIRNIVNSLVVYYFRCIDDLVAIFYAIKDLHWFPPLLLSILPELDATDCMQLYSLFVYSPFTDIRNEFSYICQRCDICVMSHHLTQHKLKYLHNSLVRLQKFVALPEFLFYVDKLANENEINTLCVTVQEKINTVSEGGLLLQLRCLTERPIVNLAFSTTSIFDNGGSSNSSSIAVPHAYIQEFLLLNPKLATMFNSSAQNLSRKRKKKVTLAMHSTNNSSYEPRALCDQLIRMFHLIAKRSREGTDDRVCRETSVDLVDFQLFFAHISRILTTSLDEFTWRIILEFVEAIHNVCKELCVVISDKYTRKVLTLDESTVKIKLEMFSLQLLKSILVGLFFVLNQSEPSYNVFKNCESIVNWGCQVAFIIVVHKETNDEASACLSSIHDLLQCSI